MAIAVALIFIVVLNHSENVRFVLAIFTHPPCTLSLPKMQQHGRLISRFVVAFLAKRGSKSVLLWATIVQIVSSCSPP